MVSCMGGFGEDAVPVKCVGLVIELVGQLCEILHSRVLVIRWGMVRNYNGRQFKYMLWYLK